MTNPINDAEAYGVYIVEAVIPEGSDYWRVIRVHHLTPEENGGKHHIFLDTLDEAGDRLLGTRVLVGWEGGSDIVTIDRPVGEAGANFPMWKWQICHTEVQGLPSDRVENLRTDHPDEPPGNTFFHHSFEVVYQRAIKGPVQPPNSSVLGGRVPDGAGHTLSLRSETGEEVASTVVDENEAYLFEQLGAGRYTIHDTDDKRVVGPVELNGFNNVQLDFPPVLSGKALNHYLLFGQVTSSLTQLHLSLIAEYTSDNEYASGFSIGDASQADFVTLVGDHPPETRETLEAAGCEVDQLPSDPSELLDAIGD